MLEFLLRWWISLRQDWISKQIFVMNSPFSKQWNITEVLSEWNWSNIALVAESVRKYRSLKLIIFSLLICSPFFLNIEWFEYSLVFTYDSMICTHKYKCLLLIAPSSSSSARSLPYSWRCFILIIIVLIRLMISREELNEADGCMRLWATKFLCNHHCI